MTVLKKVEASGSFFEKKEPKKRLSRGLRRRKIPALKKQKFFGSFFQKRTFLLRLKAKCPRSAAA